MATRGRDLTIGVISQTEKFNLDDPAKQLDDLGQSATDAAREVKDGAKDSERALSDLGDAAKSAGRDVDAGLDKATKSLDGLGPKAAETKRDFSAMVDKIGAESKKLGRDVDAGTDKAKKGLDNFKEEAGQSGREGAASFSGGFSDVGDFIQETVANGLAGLGPIGAAAGIAGAAGIGILTSAISEASERVAQMRQALTDLVRSGEATSQNKLSAFFDQFDPEQLDEFRGALKEVSISQTEWIDAVAEGGPRLDRMIDQINAAYDAQGLNHGSLGKLLDVTTEWNNEQDRSIEVGGFQKEALERQKNSTIDLTDVTKEQTEAQKESTAQNEALATAIGSVADGSGVMAGAIEKSATRQAKATKKTTDSWTDYKDTALGSIDDVIAKQRDLLTAAADLEKNTKTVLKRLGQDAVDWALSQGDSADEAMQLLANAPVKKGKAVVANYRKLGGQSTAGHAAGILDKQPAAESAAATVHAAVKATLEQHITGPTVGVQGPSQGLLDTIRRTIAAGIGTVPVTAEVTRFRTPKGVMII